MSTSTAAEETKKLVQASYDKIASQYTAWTDSNTSSPRLAYLDKLLAQLPPTSRVLELGCGAGVPVTQHLCAQDNVAAVVGNDISTAQIKLARERCKSEKVQFLAGDMMGLDFEPESFNGVAAFFSIFHLPQTEQPAMLGRIFSWLKPGGMLVCNFAAATAAFESRNQWTHFGAEMFWSGLGVEGTKAMLELAGFEVGEATVMGGEDLDRGDPDYGVSFLWIVARKGGGLAE